MKDDPRRQEKFRAALAEVRQSLIDSVVERCQSEQRPVPSQFRELVCELAGGRRPKRSALFDLGRAIPVMLTILSGNVIAPYEIKTKEEQRKRALEDFAAFLDFPSGVGTDVFQALREARKAIKESDWRRASWIGLAAAGGGLLLLGPFGLIMAAPAHLAGGAAIVAALAAFGPGGMVGGLAAAGGIMAAGGGAAGAAINALASAPEASVEHTLAQLVATSIARQKLLEQAAARRSGNDTVEIALIVVPTRDCRLAALVRRL